MDRKVENEREVFKKRITKPDNTVTYTEKVLNKQTFPQLTLVL